MNRKSRAIAIVNQKGGVGKSTTTINLGTCLAQAGRRVVLVDLDPQGNSTSGLGLDKGSRSSCVYNALIEEAPIKDLIESTQIENLFVVPATIQLAGAEIELVSTISRETKLKRAIEPLREDFEYILIDCPPSLGLLTVNALTAADQIIIPIQCEYYALEGLSKLLESVKLIRQHLNPDLEIAGVLMTMHDSRTKLSQQVVDEVAKYFKDKVYKTIIPRTVRLSEAPSFGQPITIYDPVCQGSLAYQGFAKEVMDRG
ncbi:MAG: AAA family ATPase [Actinomycetota bacterium]|nr:AAA family ATPase [Actinomycetota bacterium]